MGFQSVSRRLLNYLDIFRFPLTLTFKGYEKNSTSIGKFFTLGIIIFLFYSFLVSDLINKRNPNILSQDLILESRPTIFLSKNNFTIALGIADDANNFYVNESIYFFWFCKQYSNNTNHTYIEKCQKLELCQQDDFIENPKDFKKLGLDGSYCLPDNETFKLSGYWDEEIVENFWVELRSCENSTENNFSCQSRETIDSILVKYYLIYMFHLLVSIPQITKIR